MFVNKKEIFERYVLICALVGGSVGVALGHIWESLTPLIASIIGLIALDFQLNGNPNKHDKDLFNKFLEAFPSDGNSLIFCRDFDMASGSFNWANLEELRHFSEKWVTPEHSFINKQLESIRLRLQKTASSYLSYLAVNSWVLPHRTDEVIASVPSEWVNDGQLDRFVDVTTKLNSSADDIVKLHRELVALGIKKGLKN